MTAGLPNQTKTAVSVNRPGEGFIRVFFGTNIAFKFAKNNIELNFL
jgi:hypothetical protein